MGLDLIYLNSTLWRIKCHDVPSNANMKMKRNRRSRSDRMDDMALVKATTRLRREDQYLKYWVSEGRALPSPCWQLFFFLLCNFKNSQEPESSKSWDTERVSTRVVVNPPLFKQWSQYNKAVKPIESRLKVSHLQRLKVNQSIVLLYNISTHQSQGVHPNTHLEHEQGQKHKLAINWNG